MRIAIISDLHVGESSRAKDFCPIVSDKPFDENYKDKFLDFISKESIRADYLVVCGDVSCTGVVDEIQLCSTIVSDIYNGLGANRLFFVPGNHDKDWSFYNMKGDKSGYWNKHIYTALEDNGGILAESIKLSEGELLNNPYYSMWETDDIFAVGINTAFHDKHDEKVHHGYVSTEIVSGLEKSLKGIVDKDKVKIFVMHHHPISYTELLPEDKDFSVLQNSDNLRKIIEGSEFDIVIHGHRHVPQVKIESVNYGIPIVYICSGSFSAKIASKYSGTINNTFHIVEIDERCPNTKRMKGRVLTWSFTTVDKWHESLKQSDGIDHVTKFGCIKIKPEIKNILKASITLAFESSKILQLDTLLNDTEELRYANFDQLFFILKELETEIGFKLFKTGEEKFLVKK